MHASSGTGAGDAVARPRSVVAVWLFLLALVAGSTVLRVRTALADPNFDGERAEGMLKSDPALLYYLTERVIEAGGGIPADWGDERRIQSPYSTDVAAEFTVGQEFLLAWTQLALTAAGRAPPLHVTALWLFGFLASLGTICVYGLVREVNAPRTRSAAPALVAATVWALLPANHRTIGFILVREDLALPCLWFALWAVARAARVDTRRAWFLAGLPLAGALATWHATGFFLAVLLAAPLLWLVRGGASPFASRSAPFVLLLPAVACLVVPALRAAGTIASLPALLVGALVAAGLAERRGARPETRLAFAVGGAGALLIVAGSLRALSGEPGAYAHVLDVLVAKLTRLGVPPLDPNGISFDARLLWQGPFETLEPGRFAFQLGLAAVFLLPAIAVTWWGLGPRGPERVRAARHVTQGELLLALALLASLPAAWLVGRTVVLSGMLVAAWVGVALARLPQERTRLGAGVALIALQASAFVPWISGFASSWYLPPGRQAEIAALVEWVDEHVPAGEVVAADFMNGTALLAHTGVRNVLQPKYETDRSRRQAERFLTTFFHGSPAEFLSLVRGELRADYLLVDRYTLGVLSRWTAGLPATAPLPAGTAAELFLSQDDALLENVAGTRLVYRSPPHIQQSNGAPYDLFRLYDLDP